MGEKAAFPERLKDLMEEEGITSESLAEKIGVNGSSVRYWLEGKYFIYLSNAVKLSNYFKCSLDYLFGESNDDSKIPPLENYSFYDRLKAVMKEKGVKRKTLTMETEIKDSYLTNWKHGKNPRMVAVIAICEYLNVSIDYLLRGNY